MNSRTALLLFLVSVAVIWYGVIWIGQLAPIVLPPPHLVVMVIAKEWSALLYNTVVTLGTALIGYFFANLIAILLAISFLYLSWLRSLATPWVIVIKNLPIVSVASLQSHEGI